MNAPLVIMVGADKGGVGKTTVARALIDYLAARNLPHRAFDTEHPRGGLKRFVPAAEVIDIETIDGQMQVFDSLAATSVIDVRAGMLSRILGLLDRAHLLDDVKAGTVGLSLLHVLGPSVQSLGEVPEAAAAIGGGSRHFIVKNYISETTGYFDWDSPASKLADVFVQLAPHTVTVPHLEDRAGETIDKLGASFDFFSRDAGQSRMLRGLVRTWLDNVWKDFDKIGLGQLAEAARAA